MTERSKLYKPTPGQRVDAIDMVRGTFQGARSLVGAALGAIVVDRTEQPGNNEQSRILSGFEVTSPTSTTIKIVRGEAVLPYRAEGSVYDALVTAQGESERTLDISALANGTYGVYIRFDFVDHDVSSRVYWDEVNTTEIVQNTPAVQAEDWSTLVELTSVTAGEEWIHIADVVIASGAVSGSITDRRGFLFDTRASASVLTDVDWGTTADRSSSTRSYLGSLSKFAKAVLRQLQDAIGENYWFDEIEYSLKELLPLDGNRDMVGTITSTVGAATDALYSANGDITLGAGDIALNTGDVTSATGSLVASTGQIRGASARVTAAHPGASATSDTRYVGQMVGAVGKMSIATGVLTVSKNVNCTCVMSAGSDAIEVSFAKNMADGNYAVVFATDGNAAIKGYRPVADNQAASGFEIKLRDLDSSYDLEGSWVSASVSGVIYFIVAGDTA